MTRILFVFLTVLALAGLGARAAQAQSSHTLEIRDGQVFVDGKRLAPEALPPALDLRDVSARLTYAGDATPVLELGGVIYAFDGERLREAGPDMPVLWLFDSANPTQQFWVRPAETRPGARLLREHADALQASSQELARLEGQVDQRQAEALIEQARRQTEQATLLVRAMPRLEVQSYLQDVQQEDQELYLRLVREWQLEAEVQALAAEARTLPAAEAQQHYDALRTRLQEIFELKQQNRRREIVQLELQLKELQERLLQREELREQLVERRLLELIDADENR